MDEPRHGQIRNFLTFAGGREEITMVGEITKSKPRYEGMRVTREIYLDLEDDGFKYDVINGEMQLSPSAFFPHNLTRDNIRGLMNSFIKKRKLGFIVTETDVLLPDGGDPLRPDISFILSENMGIVHGHIHGTPDLIVEVLSPSTTKRDRGEKADRYLACGVKEYWLADPDEKTLHVWLNQGKEWQKATGDRLASHLLDGFTLDKAEVWE